MNVIKHDKHDKMGQNKTKWQNMTSLKKHNKSDNMQQVWQNISTVTKYKCDICDIFYIGYVLQACKVRSSRVRSNQAILCQVRSGQDRLGKVRSSG